MTRITALLSASVLALSSVASAQVVTNPGPGSSPTYTATGSSSGSSATGLFTAGTLSYSDTGNLAALQASINGVAQVQVQNTNAGSTASADIIVANDQGTASTHYGDFGINSSGFTGTGSFNLAGATYLYSATGDLVLGTITSNGIRFVVNNGATDTMAISAAGATSMLLSPGASTSALTLSGSAYTAGSATTNFPLFAIWPSGATGPTTWSAAGTYFGINEASGFTGNAIDIHSNGGVSIFKVDAFGNVTGASGGGFLLQGAGYLSIANRKVAIGTAVTIASGFCATTPTITSATSASFTVNVGTSCTGAKSGVLTMPTGATNGWVCTVTDATTNATYSLSAFSTSTTSVTVNNYNRTTGLAADFNASDVLQIMCMGN